MNDEIPSLFDVEAPATSTAQDPLPVRSDQVAQIREEFERAGITGQDQRKEIVESVTFRSVASLRDLRAVEAHRILKVIKGMQTSKPDRKGSAWDNREEDTWIDKL
ncbi:hypothetical protein [Pseudarthrobacter sp. SSS035]|uniref:hypothetical protein n=1 Tax=Pseudarthrobacter sp. SSS035 TaxID=2931399 RepID=UPI00200EAFD4|nr:hypothetical protein [Pseudarthrobacter sp. SSS035]